MNYEQFAIWLHGFLEISNVESIDKNQTQIIKDHLALLFEKKTPIRREKKDINHLEILQKYNEFPVVRDHYPQYYPVLPPSDAFKTICDIDLNTKFDTELHKNKTYC
jgi:hypothetical protein